MLLSLLKSLTHQLASCHHANDTIEASEATRSNLRPAPCSNDYSSAKSTSQQLPPKSTSPLHPLLLNRDAPLSALGLHHYFDRDTDSGHYLLAALLAAPLPHEKLNVSG